MNTQYMWKIRKTKSTITTVGVPKGIRRGCPLSSTSHSMFTSDKVRTTIARKVTGSSDTRNSNIDAIIGRR